MKGTSRHDVVAWSRESRKPVGAGLASAICGSWTELRIRGFVVVESSLTAKNVRTFAKAAEKAVGAAILEQIGNERPLRHCDDGGDEAETEVVCRHRAAACCLLILSIECTCPRVHEVQLL